MSGMGFTESSALVATGAGSSGQLGPQTPLGARVRYAGAVVSLTGTSTGAQVRIHKNGVVGGPVIDSFNLNSTIPVVQHIIEPNVDAGTGIYVEVVSIAGATPTADVVVYWR